MGSDRNGDTVSGTCASSGWGSENIWVSRLSLPLVCVLAQAHHCDCIAPAVCIAYEAEWRQRINMNICAHSAALRAEPCRERGASSIHAVKLTFVMHIACALDRGTEDGMVLFVEKRGSLSVVGRLKKKGVAVWSCACCR